MTRASFVFALVPVRALTDAKRRLSPLLADAERAQLARVMLEDALDCLARAPVVEGIAVVTGDTDAGALASDYRAFALPDSPEGGLNASLESAAAWARAAKVDRALLVLPADVPGATPDDIAALAAETVVGRSARASPPSDVVLARAHDGGTNALLLRPGARIPFAFGPDSCARHAAAARAAGLSVGVVERPGLALDLDRPGDVALYLARAGSSRTLGLLHRLGVPARLREKAHP